MGAAAVGVIPAAGRSRRMGHPKLLLPWGGTTILGATIAALRKGGVGRLLVVRAPGDDALAAWADAHGIELAVNPQPERGMLSTILAGLARLAEPGAATPVDTPVVVSPGDLPGLAATTVETVLREAATGRHSLVLPTCGGRRGHPLWIAPRLVGEIPSLDPAVGLRGLRLAHPTEICEVPVDDPGAIGDVDTPEDYRARVPRRSC